MRTPRYVRPGRSIAVSVLALILGGCIGFSKSRTAYVIVTSPLKTKSDVLKQFGEPRRKTQEQELEAWYYLLSGRGVTDKNPVTQTFNGAILIIIPIWWRSDVSDNARFLFRGDDLVAVAELRDQPVGFLCGIQMAHGFGTVCETEKH